MDAFDVGAYLGRGGFATVYRAVERATGRTVALKVVDTHKLREAGVDAERLEREIALHATCMNERVVTLQGSFAFDSRRDLGTEDDACDHMQGVCLVLENCPGGDLRPSYGCGGQGLFKRRPGGAGVFTRQEHRPPRHQTEQRVAGRHESN